MKKREFAIGMALLVGLIGFGTPAGAQDVISKEIASEGSYCHMKFPAIDEDTLSGSTPSLNNSAISSTSTAHAIVIRWAMMKFCLRDCSRSIGSKQSFQIEE